MYVSLCHIDPLRLRMKVEQEKNHIAKLIYPNGNGILQSTFILWDLSIQGGRRGVVSESFHF